MSKKGRKTHVRRKARERANREGIDWRKALSLEYEAMQREIKRHR